MQQRHTEQTIRHQDGQQDTGNHHRAGAPDQKGADRFGGTRAGAENVEKERPEKGDARAMGSAGGGMEKPGGTGQGAQGVEKIIEQPHEGDLHEVHPTRDERNLV